MRRGRSIAVVAAIGLGVLGGVPLAAPAFAAAPANDVVTAAKAISAVPYSDAVDTREAQATQDETDWNAYCGAPALEHAVWYRITPSADFYIGLDVQQSSYSAGILALEGTPGNFSPLGCAPGAIGGPVFAGVSYYFMVFGDGLTAETGGDLVFTAAELPPPPDVAVTVDPYGSVDRYGTVRVTGTVRCTSADGQGDIYDVFGSIRQQAGRLYIDGFVSGFVGAPCDGATHRWEAFGTGDNGIFKAGKTLTFVGAFACNLGGCSEGYAEATIQLRGAGTGKK